MKEITMINIETHIANGGSVELVYLQNKEIEYYIKSRSQLIVDYHVNELNDRFKNNINPSEADIEKCKKNIYEALENDEDLKAARMIAATKLSVAIKSTIMINK